MPKFGHRPRRVGDGSTIVLTWLTASAGGGIITAPLFDQYVHENTE